MICNTCALDKELIDFPKSTGTKLGVRKKCKICYAAYMKEYFAKNPKQYERHKGFVKRNDKEYKRQWTRHGLTEQEFKSMIDRYDGKCWSCKDKMASCIDHDHSCCPNAYSCGDCVRGLLCINCNTIIGFANDSVEILNRSIEYLQAPRVAGSHK